MIVILALVGWWIFSAPRVPEIPPGADLATVKAILENYRTLQQIALEPLTALFDSIVFKVLLPVFTGILGYIFGSKQPPHQLFRAGISGVLQVHRLRRLRLLAPPHIPHMAP